MQKYESTPIPLVIYGVPFHNVTFNEAVEWIVDRVRSGRPANIATANLDFVTKAWHDPELQRILIDADLVLADGFPMVKLSPFFGPQLKDRVTGSDLTPLLAARAAQDGLSVFGLGGAAGVAEKALEILKKRHPELKIAGSYSPPFAPLLDMDHRKILQRLEKSRPDILLVAFGSPKQEKFISMHVRGWNVPVTMGIGASLDFIAGAQRRAPVFFQKCCLEWLWRICSNPRRLFIRYLANLHFLFSASRQMFLINQMRDKPGPFQTLEDSDFQTLEKMGIAADRFQPLESETLAAEFVTRIDGVAQGRNLLLDLHALPWLNSLELGALLEINKFCRQWGKRLILYAPRSKVRRLLEICRLTDYFNVATRIDEVQGIVEFIEEHVEGEMAYEMGALKLELPVELTAATLPAFEQQMSFIHEELKEKGGLKTVEVDASQLDFIDSSGLGFLISLKKTTQGKGVSMSITHLAPKPRRTFEIARVDKILLHS
ncbi:WecB/TagA/CpsF family glycosyltransferase [Pontiellaceae bacterium B1224]|nr:WecB/TagA/CpsF family glycosyltransferase [Pontiellaceae bacterium B1224]